MLLNAMSRSPEGRCQQSTILKPGIIIYLPQACQGTPLISGRNFLSLIDNVQYIMSARLIPFRHD
jgi:hypothetical protein